MPILVTDILYKLSFSYLVVQAFWEVAGRRWVTDTKNSSTTGIPLSNNLGGASGISLNRRTT